MLATCANGKFFSVSNSTGMAQGIVPVLLTQFVVYVVR